LHQRIADAPVVTDQAGDWRVRFHHHPLGVIDRKLNRLRRASGPAPQPPKL
jgi:hypothetical protein